MVQLRKSRKSFRKTRGRKTRQRKNEKRKSRKTRSTRKTGGGGEETIAHNVYKLASNIGELIKHLDKVEPDYSLMFKSAESQQIFLWLTSKKRMMSRSNSCEMDGWKERVRAPAATCHRKKMIYYYIAINLFICYKKLILNEVDAYGIEKKLIAKFKKHKTSYKGYKLTASSIIRLDSSAAVPEIISEIHKTLYDSILEENERAVDKGEGVTQAEDVVKKILSEVEIPDDKMRWNEELALVEYIHELKNFKK